jgi:hypothetical protein
MVILGTGLIAVLLSELVLRCAVRHAPVGREDEEGFHADGAAIVPAWKSAWRLAADQSESGSKQGDWAIGNSDAGPESPC